MATFEEIPLGQLRFDPANPRFPRTDHERTLEDVLRFMLKDAGTLDLMRSIAQQGFFPGEPILVTPDGDEFIVVEGTGLRRALRPAVQLDVGEGAVQAAFVGRSEEIVGEVEVTQARPSVASPGELADAGVGQVAAGDLERLEAVRRG